MPPLRMTMIIGEHCLVHFDPFQSSFGRFKVIFDTFWSLLVPFSPFWCLLISFDLFRPILVPLGPCWSFLVPISPFLVPFSSFLVTFGTFLDNFLWPITSYFLSNIVHSYPLFYIFWPNTRAFLPLLNILNAKIKPNSEDVDFCNSRHVICS